MGGQATRPTLVMGILNVTPDSFSDGGRWTDVDAAVAQGLRLAADGAALVDVGGESTRPGAARVAPSEERERVIPVIEALTEAGVETSIDTMHADTAVAAVSAGASVVNDVSGGLADARMAPAVAELGCEYVAMHWRAHSHEMDAADVYEDIVREVGDELAARVDALTRAGVDESRVILDPGLGFAKVTDSNWPLLADLDWARGHRVLIGASRKRFLGAAIAAVGGDGADPSAREHATTAVTTASALRGVWGVRVHDAAAARDAIAVVSALTNTSHRAR